MKPIACALLAVLTVGPVAASPTHSQAPASGWKVGERIPLPGPGGWDYLSIDPAHHHLFVTRGDRVQVLDLRTHRLDGTIADTPGVHGVVVDGALDRGFTSNGKTSTVTAFDLQNLKSLGVIKGVGERPDAIVFDPASGHVLTLNGGGRSASVVDPRKLAVIDTIKLPGKPEFARADGKGHVYVNIEDRSKLVELDTRTDKVSRSWGLASCESPSGLALDAKHHRAFSVCDNQKMVISDTQRGRVVASVAIGEGPDAAAFDPATERAFSCNGQSGTVTVVKERSPNDYVVLANVPTRRSARTCVLDPSGKQLYLSSAELGPPAPGHHWPSVVPGSFAVLVLPTNQAPHG